MGVFRNVTFEWGEEKFEFVPSMALLERLEDIIPMSQLAMDLQAGKMKSATAARLVHAVAAASGASLSLEEVYQVINTVKPADRLDILVGIIEAFSPKAPEGKKPMARLVVGPKE